MRLCNEEDDQFAATSTPPIPEFDLAGLWGLAVIRADYESGMDVHDGCGGGADYRRRHLRLAFDGVRTERARGANRRREVRRSHAAARGNSGDSERLEESAAATPEMLEHGRNHWADHCATCHANNESGDTMIGKNFYPKAPDMRLPPTQSLTDGELYYIIRNGVRMTGMPAWGNPQDGDLDHETWMLVLFIRHLPQVTSEESTRCRN